MIFNNAIEKKKPSFMHGDLPATVSIGELQSCVEALEKDFLLYEETSFDRRYDAIDFLEFQVFDQIEALMRNSGQPDKLISLRSRAGKLKSVLEKIDNALFHLLKAKIRKDGFREKGFKELIEEYFVFNPDQEYSAEALGYDNFDVLINGLFLDQPMPRETGDLEAEMACYQKTPARIVFELVEKSEFKPEDVFIDLGSGLGQVAILVNLLAGIEAIGVEVVPAFCVYADNCAKDLCLSNVRFINVDARKADYSEGTVFFMFTPFRGKILEDVLEHLRKESLKRKIKVIAYGPCTEQVAMERWLDFADKKNVSIYKPAVFVSS